uniref:Tetratricopeptide repeat protein 17 n=1 Tax=Plectus sambesii TaxID=2011161 RepID=A0A914XPD7_9BILA
MLWRKKRDAEVLFLLASLLLTDVRSVRGATHWMVTEEGLSIQAATDSLYNMAQPHDLVQFLRQEERVGLATSAESVISGQKSSIKRRESKDDPDIENKMMENDPDCKKAGETLAKQDLFASYAIVPADLGFDMETSLGKPRTISSNVELLEPHCAKNMRLSFSMAAFEHLKGLYSRETLATSVELDLKSKVLGEWERLADFGHFVALALNENPNDWLLYNLATFYWRISGNALEAVECCRRALHLTPRKAYAMPLLNLGNILHRASHSKDAVVVLSVLVSLDDSMAAGHCALGDALVLSGNYTEAITVYSRCLRADGSFPNADRKRAAVRCHKKLESALEMQHENLQRTISELKSYEKRLESVRNIHENVLNSVADPETKQQANLVYDFFTYGPIEHSHCETVEEEGRKGKASMVCTVDSWDGYRRALDAKHEALYGSKRASRTDHRPTPATASDDDEEEETFDSSTWTTEERSFFRNLEPYRAMDLDEPQLQRRYPILNKAHLTAEDYVFLDLTWPNQTDCEKTRPQLPQRHDFPSIFVSPENKGYIVVDLLTKYLNLDASAEHPLPWYPPFCSTAAKDLHVPAVDHLQGVIIAGKKTATSVAEEGLRSILMELAGNPAGQSDADVGQRINTLLNYAIGPRWILLNLAALYWRVLGVPSEAVACLRMALAEQPERYPDVALIQLAQLVITAGGDRYDDAITLLNKAIERDNFEPAPQYLLGLIRIFKQNFTGAHAHIRVALEADPRFPGARHAVRALRCSMRYSPSRLPENAVAVPCPEHVVQNFFCLIDTEGKERCYIEEKHRDLARMTGKEPTSQNDKLVSGCVNPPPLASLLPPVSKEKESELNSETKQDPSDLPAKEKVVPKGMKDINVPTMTNYEEEDESDEVPLDFGMGDERKTAKPVRPPPSKTEVNYDTPPGHSVHAQAQEWQQEVELPRGTLQLPPMPELEELTDRKQVLAYDAALPEILPFPFPDQVEKGMTLVTNLPTTTADCTKLQKRVNLEQATSTWLSVTAKGVRLENYMDFNTPVPGIAGLEPVCPDLENSTMWTLDHLNGYHYRDRLHFYRPEKGLKEAFQSLGNDKERIEHVAARLTLAMKISRIQEHMSKGQDGGVHWTLTTVAALYWRVKGDALNAIKCLRHSLNNAPADMRDLALVSMANVYHQAGMLHSALIAGGAALQQSPKFVVIHFTIANIYAAMGDLDRAMQFYYSTLALQNNFEPAKERIRTIHCIQGKLPPHSTEHDSL